MNRRVTVSALLGVLLLSAGAAWALPPAGPTWQPREFITGNVFLPGHFGADRILEYDHWGNPGVAIDSFYFQEPRPYEWVGYWRRSALGWQSQLVDYHYLEMGPPGMYPSLSYDRYERPSISYMNWTDQGQLFGGQMHFAHWDANNWWVITRDMNPIQPSGMYTSLAYDRLGLPAVAFQDAVTALRFYYDSGNYRIEVPTEVSYACTWPMCGYTPTLAFDKINRPWIAHIQMMPDGMGGNLLLTMNDPGIGWRTAVIDPKAQNTGLSLAINPRTGEPAIVYQRADNSLMYAEFDGNAWHQTVLATGLIAGGREPSLAFDPGDGNPAVAYIDALQQALVFAWYDGSGWQRQIVDAQFPFTNPSLAFNEYGSGWPGIVYFDMQGNAYFIEDPQIVPEPTCLTLLLAGAWFYRRRLGRRG